MTMRPCFCKSLDVKCHFCRLAANRDDYRELFVKLDADPRCVFGVALTAEQREALNNLPEIDCCGPPAYDSMGAKEGPRP